MNRVLVWLGLMDVFGVVTGDRTCAQQVIPDGTLNTIVNSNNGDFTIINGTAVGNNLFHSFREFSIPNNGSATFDLINTPNISTIFSRVTGSAVSRVDGLLKTINSSNPVSLFLLNPNGILFGADAKLEMGGSFVGTTANSIKFADGGEFATQNAAPLLTMSVPIGLQFGRNPGNIHNAAALPVGLAVQPGNSISLVGGMVSFNGGAANASSGNITIGHLD